MIEAGILTNEDKVELLEGQIIQMSPQRPPHAATTQCAANYLSRLLKQAYIRVQLPVTLPPNSEPEPDIAVVCIDDREYFDHHPAADEIFLLVEVAKTTLKNDRITKAPTYAKAKIPEYWILDVQERQVYVFREPEAESYQQEIILSEDATISLLAFPDVNVSLNQLFP
jgi:Uma2 family endonuclease